MKVTWTREDDIQNSYCRTVSVKHLEAGLDASGKPIPWLRRSAAPTFGLIFGPNPKYERAFDLSMGLVDVPFAIPNLRIENPEGAVHTRVGWFRSVPNIPHGWQAKHGHLRPFKPRQVACLD